MSEQLSPAPVTAEPLSEVVFRMLTPIFRFAIEGADCFTHSGKLKNGRFQIKLLPYAPNPTDWAEVTEYADDGIREMLRKRVIHCSDHFFGVATHVLLNDVFHPAEIISESTGNTLDCLNVQDALVDSLRQHASAGLPCHETYTFRCPPAPHSVLGVPAPNARHHRFSHLGTSSVLRRSDFDACRSTLDTLMKKSWDDNATFDRVLRLAMEYHRLSFTLERVDHAFLILMVAYEAMFKKDGTENASKPAQRIGRLIGAATKRDCQVIQKEFNDDSDSFSKIRNQIAHGDPNLSVSTVASKYPLLYGRVTSGIITLLNLPFGSLDEAKDYYDEISRYTRERFDRLPVS